MNSREVSRNPGRQITGSAVEKSHVWLISLVGNLKVATVSQYLTDMCFCMCICVLRVPWEKVYRQGVALVVFKINL